MVRYVIVVDVNKDEFNVEVSKGGKFFDEASFHPSEECEIWEYFTKLAFRILKDAGKWA